MKSNEVLELVRAGFTKEEIIAMDGTGKHAAPENPKEPDIPEEPKEPAAPEEPKEPAAPEEPKEDSALADANKRFSDAVKNFEEQMVALTKKFQDNNIIMSSMKDEGKQLTGDSVLAEIINPTRQQTELANQLFGKEVK